MWACASAFVFPAVPVCRHIHVWVSHNQKAITVLRAEACAHRHNHVVFFFLGVWNGDRVTRSRIFWVCDTFKYQYIHINIYIYLSILFFPLKVEENNTEDKSKDNVPLDSQSECTNYFLQYISTPRWYCFVFLAACFCSWLTSFIVFFFFSHVSF